MANVLKKKRGCESENKIVGSRNKKSCNFFSFFSHYVACRIFSCRAETLFLYPIFFIPPVNHALRKKRDYNNKLISGLCICSVGVVCMASVIAVE